jgi:hypothetical protein
MVQKGTVLLRHTTINRIYVETRGAYGGGERCAQGVGGERDHWGDPDVDWRIILRGIFRKWERIVGTGWSGLRIGTGGGHL